MKKALFLAASLIAVSSCYAEQNAQQVEEGQVSASELRNVIDMDAVLEEAKKNDLYSPVC